MAVIRPFHALRYNTERFPDLAAVLAPPYDVIDAGYQQELYGRDAHNVIRLEYGVINDADTDADNRYTRARQALTAWTADETLALEEQAAIYPHEQRFDWDGAAYARTGFFAAVELQPFDAGIVCAHEWTLAGPKADRLKLMSTCETSFSPVFGLYDGKNTRIGELLKAAMAQAPLATAVGNGFADTLWRVTDAEICAEISQALATRQIVIADGHHRYETMLAMRDQLRAKYPDAPANAAFNYAFMELVDISDPGLLMLPTHRLLLLTPPMCAAFCQVVAAFEQEELADTTPEALLAALAAHPDEHAYIWYADGTATLLTLPSVTINGLPQPDVEKLRSDLIAPLLAADGGSVEGNVRYTVDAATALARVDSGEANAAILMNYMPVADVLTLAGAGVRMPQKSTYFYPKIPTGLVMHKQAEVVVG